MKPEETHHDYIRPRDAATLIIVKDQREVLLGLRSHKHVFMPHRYVFPGGRVDSGDSRVPSPMRLKPEVENKLLETTTAARARALGMAAIRETFEETGLIVGTEHHTSIRSRSKHWRPFFERGVVPALDKLEYFARAVTPPGRVRRFDARFFTVDARHVSGTLRSNGELEDLQWVPIEAATTFPVATITQAILELLQDKTGQVPAGGHSQLYEELKNSELLDHNVW